MAFWLGWILSDNILAGLSFWHLELLDYHSIASWIGWIIIR